MKTTKNVLIVNDGVSDLVQISRRIAAELSGMHVVVMEGADLSATDLLPADLYFFGCSEANPRGFSELQRVLKGINLAGRACALFTIASKEAIGYLQDLVRDAELQVYPDPFLASKKRSEKEWVETILQRS